MGGEIVKLKFIAEEIQQEVARRVALLKDKVKLTCLVVGENPAAASYLNGMQRNSEKLGIQMEIHQLTEQSSEEELIHKIVQLNREEECSGIILQLPLPQQINYAVVSKFLDYRKDLDGVTPFNQGLLFSGKPFLIPATAWAVDLTLGKIMREKNKDLKGARVVIIGRSVTVGKPVFHLLLRRNMTPTIIHTKTLEAQEISSEADVVVACCGVAEMVTQTWIREEAIVIDVGINTKENAEGKIVLCGDVDAKDAVEKASVVTAVPGGIGSVTSALLFANCLKSWYKIHKNEEIRFDFEV